MIPPRRKKWTEAEEKTLIEKYGEMVSDGTLAKMKKREKKFKPIAHHVNSVHHLRDPIEYTWVWTWKDVSTKVQNMRHQYLLVKQKIKIPEFQVRDSGDDAMVDEFDWMEGLTHWSNFLRYKEVFGDVPIAYNSNNNDSTGIANEDRQKGEGLVTDGRALEMVEFEPMGRSGDGDFVRIDRGENGVLGLGFEYDAEEAEENFNGKDQIREEVEDGFGHEDVDPNRTNMKKKRKVLKGLEKKTFGFGFLLNQLRQFRDMEAQFEHRDTERERERRRRDNIRMEKELEWERKYEKREKEREERGKAREKLRRQRVQEWEALERESEERERRRREEALNQEREWEENMKRQRSDWKNRIDDVLGQHRAEMGQIQTRILNEQQNLTSQLLGIVSQWTAHPTGLSDHAGASNHYLSQMMQNLHQSMVHGDARVDGDTQDDHFIVDG